MNEVILTERSNIAAIADAVRNKTGRNDSMNLGAIVDAINSIEKGSENPVNLDAEITTQESKIASQNTLISNIVSALEGKAVASGGGSSINTCTIRFVSGDSVSFIGRYYYTKCVNEVISTEYIDTSNSTDTFDITFENVVCDSFLVFEWTSNSAFAFNIGVSITGSTTMEQLPYGQNVMESSFFKAPSEPNAIVTVTLYCY